jgi:signal transduction histidine kinase
MPQMFGNLSIRSKLIGLLAVPVAASTLVAVVGVADGAGDRTRAERDRRVAAVAVRAGTAVHELQEERVRVAAWVAGGGRRGEGELRTRRRRVDRALAAYRAGAAAIGPTGEPALDQAVRAAAERLDRLAVVRAQADRRLLTPARTHADHDTIVAALLGVARGLAARLDAPEPARVARLLLAVAGAKEATGQERGLLATVPPGGRLDPAPTTDPGTPAGEPADPPGNPSGEAARPAGAPLPGLSGRTAAAAALRARLAAAAAVARHELNGVRAAAGDRLDSVDRALDTPGARSARRLELGLLDPTLDAPASGRRRLLASQPSVADLELWRVGLTARAGALRRVERVVTGDLAEAARAWLLRRQARLRNRLVVLAAITLAAPSGLLLLLRTPLGRPGRPPAAAVGAVVGLARRGRALLDRQFQLVDGLERGESDPIRRQDLARLDQLACRLRRNAETLLAVAGPEPARRWDPAVPVAGLLRAAIAEVDDHRRVDLLASDDVEVAGPAGADLLHVVAELLDNAAAFSPPTAGVAVTAAGDGDGYLIEVTDRGLGMTDEELAWANQRLAGRRSDAPDLATGDRLGLSIVGHLAGRHGLRVRLSRSPTGGVTAAVRLPAAVLGRLSDPLPTGPVGRS